MPYIPHESRIKLSYQDNQRPETSGELNYCITTLCAEYTKTKGLSYNTINEVIGVLTCAGAEYYRRVCIPYENKKCVANGDVYDVDNEGQ